MVFEKMKLDQLQTMRLSFQEICAGEREWTALGNFMNYWFAYAKDRRQELVEEPLEDISPENTHAQHWAAYCAASVDKYQIPVPEWVHESRFTLEVVWFSLESYKQERIRQRIIDSTPPEFKKRNIYTRGNMFANKWELAEKWKHSAYAQPASPHILE